MDVRFWCTYKEVTLVIFTDDMALDMDAITLPITLHLLEGKMELLGKIRNIRI